MRGLQSSGRIAYLAPDGNLHVVDQAGQNDAALSLDAGRSQNRDRLVSYSLPTWSPAERQVAYSRSELSRGGFVTEVVVDNASGRGATAVFRSERHRTIYLSWSPDGSKITLLAQHAGEVDLELGLIDVANGGYTTLDSGTPYY
jgi:Tol biopolymer transport system component